MNDNDEIKLPDFDGLVKHVGEEILQRVKRRTPRKTGYAESRWEKTESTSDTATQVNISNDAPYIGILENGNSQQAPEGMVRITLEEIPDIITEYLRRN